jgi:hypothetical protein
MGRYIYKGKDAKNSEKKRPDKFVRPTLPLAPQLGVIGDDYEWGFWYNGFAECNTINEVLIKRVNFFHWIKGFVRADRLTHLLKWCIYPG